MANNKTYPTEQLQEPDNRASIIIRALALLLLNLTILFSVIWVTNSISTELLASFYYLLIVFLLIIGGLDIILSLMILKLSFVRSLHFFFLMFLPLIFFIAIFARLVLIISDTIFPEKVRKLLPIITAYRMLLIAISDIFISGERSAAMEAIEELGELKNQQDQVAKGYAARKAIGQTVDYGLSFAILVLLGVGPLLMENEFFAENPWIIVLVLSSFTVVISLLATLFGPVYTYFSGCKNYCLKKGAYRGASIYWKLEQLFSIPFLATKSGFMLLDMPPIDAETLQDFSSQIKNELNDIQSSVNSLLARDTSQIPSQMRSKIRDLVKQTGGGLGDLNFETIKEELAREFALSLYQLEFPLMFWRRKKAIKNFAETMGIPKNDAEDILRLINVKIDYRQAPVDMVNAILIAGAMKGIVQKEQEYHELLSDADFAEISTGLAFGVRQFIEDQYKLDTPSQRFWTRIKNFFTAIVTPFVVLFWGIGLYFQVVYEEFRFKAGSTSRHEFVEYHKMRWREILVALNNSPIIFVSKMHYLKNKVLGKDTVVVTVEGLGIDQLQVSDDILAQIPAVEPKVPAVEQKMPALPLIPEEPTPPTNPWKTFFAIIIKFIFIFPVAIIVFVKQFSGFFYRLIKNEETEENIHNRFQSDISHAALASCYVELYSKLVDASSMFHRQFDGSEPSTEN
ncbi:MAG: hypothetical protein KAR35_02600 [Candidatus Heimdallarchaeota archaeon]|nr:hypothetical protein [Candidatus Heimdallarchaeota archaeon]MCK5048244.1 hypothetical protein [Candidatus Heimdallarchaeota archaeon]